MTTTVTLPPPAPTTPTLLDKYLAFFKAHERLLIVLACLVTLFFIANRALAVWQAHDQKKVTTAKAILTPIVVDNTALTKQLATLQASIVSQNTAFSRQLTAEKAAIANMTAQQAAQRLDGTALNPGNISLPLDAARADITQLDTLPIVEKQLANETNLATSQATLITGLDKQLVDQANVCKANLATEKAHSRHNWLTGFKWGFISGVTLGLVAHHYGI